MMRTAQLSRGMLLAVLVALFLVAMGVNTAFVGGLRLDMTENKLYTLSDGMKNLLSNLEDPINLYLFFSEKGTRDQPALRNYRRRVLDVLEEYRLYSDGQLIIHSVDPEPFSEDEDRASQMGVQAVRGSGSEPVYFGLAGTNAFGAVEAIPFLQPGKELLLEYELGKLIYALSRTDKVVVGLMTSLDMMQVRVNPQTGRMNEAWLFTQQLEQLFDVRLVLIDADVIDPEIDVLIVVHPLELAEKTEYALDQFILGGGRGFFFIDPYSNEQFLPQAPGEPLPNAYAKSSNLNKLFRAWGFEIDEQNLVGDRKNALHVGLGNGQSAPHLAMFGIKQDGMNQEDVVTQGLEVLNFALASHVRALEGSGVSVTPLVQSSEQSGLVSLDQFRFVANSPDALQQGFQVTKTRYTIAGRVRGKFKSAFTAPPEGAGQSGEHIAEAADEANIVVVADSDILADRMWARVGSFLGQNIVQAFASNRDFAINTTDNLTGSNDLIGIRSRGGFSRPFTRVIEIESKAARRYKDTEKKLQEELKRVEQRLKELQKRRTDSDSGSLLTPAQQDEINQFRLEQIETRKKLRQVRHQLTADIERLGTILQALNIGVVPSIIVVFALALGLVRVRRRGKVMTENP